jgi:hypothetical protein
VVNESESLSAGLTKISALLARRGFTRASGSNGVSSGGAFTTAVFRRSSLEVNLIVRADLGCPNYSAGSGYVGHTDLVEALGRAGEEQLIAGEGMSFEARYGGDAFEALCTDLELIILPVLDASELDFRAAVDVAGVRLRQRRGW